ncbi:hypothetical protein RDI58_007193 [Solanum bulbocastanum]|uniref:Uncharacterized protein n=1 Tax=Solanum bulbocastanum TaxID=147425 RepID=A0AAN8TUQ4_SOLBU
MATEPPESEYRPPDQAQSTRNPSVYKPHVDASTESSANSSKMRRTGAIHVAISERELDWARKIISLEQSGMIRVNSADKHESTYKDLSVNQKSNDSIIQIESSKNLKFLEIASESPNERLQVRASSDVRNGISITGESSPGQGDHYTTNLVDFDGENSGDVRTDKVTGAPADKEKEQLQQMAPCDENSQPKVPQSLAQQQHINICSSFNLQDQVTMLDDELHKEVAIEAINGTQALQTEAK